MSWKAAAEQAAQEAVLAGKGEPLELVEKRIRANYPFGERKYHPYKVWLEVVRDTLRAISSPGRRSLYEECLAKNPRLKPAPDPEPKKRVTKAEREREAQAHRERMADVALNFQARPRR